MGDKVENIVLSFKNSKPDDAMIQDVWKYGIYPPRLTGARCQRFQQLHQILIEIIYELMNSLNIYLKTAMIKV